ncbi:RNA N(6)-adenosine-methyltransferase mettl16 [Amia ocellicauda]|uniref:RNA N(6)-adenosine-methyltransferase mettl16 n=1 Tax=Amia ocellicauda TaxID=2972642 RepID=UPI003464E8CA
MALNKSMHPRNRYKDKPPDFAYLASKYPEFQQHVHTNLTGRVGLNFKEPEAVRALTCTLLKEDFGLTIEIPLERLIPTVPLRLNYIHWVEDLIGGGGPRRGIDIGTGASCIYPLLGATMNGWYFLATEVDDICYDYAKRNVEQNHLSDLIKVVKVPQKTLLMDALKEETALVYDFCMCNPPFFANQLEAKGVNSRNARRPPPSSVNTGGVTEIMAEGGELEFVKRIIHDSLQLKKRLRWYSCMLGKKCSLTPLKEELRKQGVPKVTHTEFCQGRTMRWALAWSFCDDVNVPSPPSKKRKLEKARKPITFTVLGPTVRELGAKVATLGSTATGSAEIVTAWTEKILTDLRVLHKRVPCGRSEVSLFLTAVENSWIHVRQRRRDRGRQLRELPRAPPEGAGGTAQPDESQAGGQVAQDVPGQGSEVAAAPQSGESGAGADPDPRVADGGGAGEGEAEEADHLGEEEEEEEEIEGGVTRPPSAAAMQEASAGGSGAGGGQQHFLFKCLMNVKEDGGDAAVELHWVEGQNRDLMNQLCTFLKNQLFRLVASPL